MTVKYTAPISQPDIQMLGRIIFFLNEHLFIHLDTGVVYQKS